MLQGCRGDGAVFTGARLRDSSFEACILFCANLSGTSWTDCTLQDCKLREVFWPEAKLKNLQLSGCDLRRAEFHRTPLKGVDLSGCEIEGMAVSEGCSELRGLKISYTQAPYIAAMLGVEMK